MAKTSRGSVQQMLRLPDDLRDRIKGSADANGRSMNAEIVSALEKAYPRPPSPTWTAGLFASLFSEASPYSQALKFRAGFSRDQITDGVQRLQALIDAGEIDPDSPLVADESSGAITTSNGEWRLSKTSVEE